MTIRAFTNQFPHIRLPSTVLQPQIIPLQCYSTTLPTNPLSIQTSPTSASQSTKIRMPVLTPPIRSPPKPRKHDPNIPHSIGGSELGALLTSRPIAKAWTESFRVMLSKWKVNPKDSFGQQITNYRISIMAGKKAISKLAVERRRATRRIKAAALEIFPKFAKKGYDYLFFAYPPAINTPYKTLLLEMRIVLEKIDRDLKETAPLQQNYLKAQKITRPSNTPSDTDWKNNRGGEKFDWIKVPKKIREKEKFHEKNTRKGNREKEEFLSDGGKRDSQWDKEELESLDPKLRVEEDEKHEQRDVDAKSLENEKIRRKAKWDGSLGSVKRGITVL